MADTNDKITIQLMKNGSFKVNRLNKLSNSKGEELPVKETIWLCRCGASEKKPFCDGKHVEAGFKHETMDEYKPGKNKDYAADDIVVHDNRRLCSHSGECIKNLPEVFNVNKRPWIDPQKAGAEAIIQAVKRCPSGALTYSYKGETTVNIGAEDKIKVERNGPLNISGKIELLDFDGEVIETSDRYSLCRCGHSNNKPFCDGAHLKFKFRDADN